ncbi:MAG: hypothetical protein ACOX4K_06065 [Bacillota bacterium]
MVKKEGPGTSCFRNRPKVCNALLTGKDWRCYQRLLNLGHSRDSGGPGYYYADYAMVVTNNHFMARLCQESEPPRVFIISTSSKGIYHNWSNLTIRA